jgi:tRNA (adenine22-N1)-methyltransferase
MGRIDVASELIKTSFCDIGTDHGYLLTKVCQENPDIKAIGIDVNQGPLDNAKKNAIRAGLTNQIKLYLSNGLEKVDVDDLVDIKTYSVMGLGGNLIIEILKRDLAKKVFDNVLIQSNNNTNQVYDFMANQNYSVSHTKFVEDMGIIYIVSMFKKKENAQISNKYIYEKETRDLALKYFDNDLTYYQQLLTKIPKNHENVQKIKDSINRIELEKGRINEIK